jgi:DNA (cytosine-5)-methyltransferase 1
MNKKIRVVELFAGVGGFRLGFENASHLFDTIWSNQWEPKKKIQHASNCYIKNFGNENHVCEDISIVKTDIPKHDLLVGGFPCQDYSVATTNAQGIIGQKGVLWWEINDILEVKRPSYVVLENVDRLLRSPSKQRGRDFAIILWCLNNLGYNVEWRVINAADYGFPQKRRRVYIFGAQKGTDWSSIIGENSSKNNYLSDLGFFSNEFKVKSELKLNLENYDVLIPDDIVKVSNDFEYHFFNSGSMNNGMVWTRKLEPFQQNKKTLREILDSNVDDKYYIYGEENLKRWKYLKGSKKELRVTEEGFTYNYSEGSLPFPDNLDEPARTILTSEGGLHPSRIKHIILDPIKNKYRILTPVEVERINGFPDNWTDGMPEGWRYFCMGNALVVGVITKIGRTLLLK